MAKHSGNKFEMGIGITDEGLETSFAINGEWSDRRAFYEVEHIWNRMLNEAGEESLVNNEWYLTKLNEVANELFDDMKNMVIRVERRHLTNLEYMLLNAFTVCKFEEDFKNDYCPSKVIEWKNFRFENGMKCCEKEIRNLCKEISPTSIDTNLDMMDIGNQDEVTGIEGIILRGKIHNFRVDRLNNFLLKEIGEV